VVLFAIGEISGRIFALIYPTLDANVAYHFIKVVLSKLKDDPDSAPMTELWTPFHWAFCDEEHPASNGHRFCLFCAHNNIERRIASSKPAQITVLEKGWPGAPAPIKPKQRRKPKAARPSKEASPAASQARDPSLI
jgi:hypothetical protein